MFIITPSVQTVSASLDNEDLWLFSIIIRCKNKAKIPQMRHERTSCSMYTTQSTNGFQLYLINPFSSLGRQLLRDLLAWKSNETKLKLVINQRCFNYSFHFASTSCFLVHTSIKLLTLPPNSPKTRFQVARYSALWCTGETSYFLFCSTNLIMVKCIKVQWLRKIWNSCKLYILMLTIPNPAGWKQF